MCTCWITSVWRGEVFNKSMSYYMRFNVVFVGSVGTGKTSIIKKKTNQSKASHVSTIAVDFVTMKLGDFDASVWDTCGQERFMSITSSYFMRGHVFVLVHDVIDSDVMQDLEKWRKEIVKKKPARHSPVIIVVSNKIDLAPFCSQPVSEWISKHMLTKCIHLPNQVKELMLYLQK